MASCPWWSLAAIQLEMPDGLRSVWAKKFSSVGSSCSWQTRWLSMMVWRSCAEFESRKVRLSIEQITLGIFWWLLFLLISAARLREFWPPGTNKALIQNELHELFCLIRTIKTDIGVTILITQLNVIIRCFGLLLITNEASRIHLIKARHN